MLKSLLLNAVLLVSLETYGQEGKKEGFDIRSSLQGEWIGSFDDPDIFGMKVSPIKLFFKLTNDSTYKIYSYSKGMDTIIVCQLDYKILQRDSIYLEETRVLLPKRNPGESCPQRMHLKVKQRMLEIEMEGIWEAIAPKCNMSGSIRFKKKRA